MGADDLAPALESVKEKLEAGGRVAGVGCGHAASTVIMAQAYPKSTFFGYQQKLGVETRTTATVRALKILDISNH